MYQYMQHTKKEKDEISFESMLLCVIICDVVDAQALL